MIACNINDKIWFGLLFGAMFNWKLMERKLPKNSCISTYCKLNYGAN